MSGKVLRQKIGRGIYLLRFDSQYDLAATFLRVQEHYESPRFHGRVFSLEEYADWYAAQYGNFTYYQDWAGFNVPSTALRAFYLGKFDPLTRKEQHLLRLFKTLRGRFYIVGIFGRRGGDLTHELAHALFFTNAKYRNAVRRTLGTYSTGMLERQLVKVGYARHVILDELQAYLIAPSGKLGAASKRLVPLRRKLRALFREHTERLSVPLIRRNSPEGS